MSTTTNDTTRVDEAFAWARIEELGIVYALPRAGHQQWVDHSAEPLIADRRSVVLTMQTPADVRAWAAQLSAEVRETTEVLPLDEDDWSGPWVARRRVHARVRDWLPGVALTVQFTDSRLAVSS